MTPKKLWLTLAAVILGSFAVLCFYGVEIFREMPPFPNKVVTESGETLFEGQDIKDGQNVWQSIGGQTVGSVWGHGAYVAPDWTADYLHRESELMLAELRKMVRYITSWTRQTRLSIRCCCKKSSVRIHMTHRQALSPLVRCVLKWQSNCIIIMPNYS